jgi:hypothetical protein
MEILSRTPSVLVAVLSGLLNRDGCLDESTMTRLRKAKEAADTALKSGCRYFYIFPDSRKVGELRVCDVMKQQILILDEKAACVFVPDIGQALLLESERQDFVNNQKEFIPLRSTIYIP